MKFITMFPLYCSLCLISFHFIYIVHNFLAFFANVYIYHWDFEFFFVILGRTKPLFWIQVKSVCMHTCVSLCVWVSVFNGSGNLLVDKIFLNQFTAKISTGEMQCIRLLTICRFEHMMGTIKTSPFFIGMDWLIISFSSLFLSFSRSLSEYSNMIYIFSKDFYSIITIFIHFYHYSLLLLFCSLFKYI